MKNLADEYDYGKYRLGDLFEPIRDALSTGRFVLDAQTGKIRPREKFLSDWDTPWFHTKHLDGANCGLWHRFMFDYYNFIPSGCMNCWKVVVRPQWLEDLFKLMEFQLELDKPSKCGVELRPNVYGVYGGYFYNRSKEEGQERYEEVVKGCEKYNINFLIGKDGPIKPLLKRGCTEFEMEKGPSDQWKQSPEDKLLEEIICKHTDISPLEQPRVNRVHVIRKWIEQAYSVGDPTVWMFNENQPYYKPYVTYHQEVKHA